jgi:hypothetical protein
MSLWTANDIETLSVYYTKGFPIKEISRRLGRSPTALHKAISRYKLHPLKSDKPKDKTKEILPSTSIFKEHNEKSYIKKFFQKCMNENWVSFNNVVDYLRQKGIDVEFLDKKNNNHEDLYALNNKVFVAPQVLLVANKLRIEEKKMPFKVENVSW